MTDISPEIINILENDFKTFMMVCIKKEDLNEILKDPVCNGADDVVYFFNLYLQLLLEHKKGVRLLYNKLTKGGYDKRKSNVFIYKLLKLKHKQKHRIWSWEELMTYEIDYDPEITTTTTYTIE
jgi:hypothetical protein